MKIPVARIKYFAVTGLLYNSNKRFISTYDNLNTALMINLWRGSVWVVLDNNTRKLIKRVWN